MAFLPYDAQRGRDAGFLAVPDTEGVENRTGHELDAFVFTERGVYRPGRHAPCRRDRQAARLERRASPGCRWKPRSSMRADNPCRCKPLVLARPSGFTEWTYATTPDSPTGGYTLNVYLKKRRQTLHATRLEGPYR